MMNFFFFSPAGLLGAVIRACSAIYINSERVKPDKAVNNSNDNNH